MKEVFQMIQIIGFAPSELRDHLKDVLHSDSTVNQMLPKFGGGETDNLELWQSKVRMYKATKDLQECVEAPPLPQSSDRNATKRDKKAQTIICTCLSDAVLGSVINLPDSYTG